MLVCDGAGWHQTGQRLTVPDNLTLLRLPPYSPELNPIENVWEYLRSNKLSRRVWETYEDIVQACCDAWNWLIADTLRVASDHHPHMGIGQFLRLLVSERCLGHWTGRGSDVPQLHKKCLSYASAWRRRATCL